MQVDITPGIPRVLQSIKVHEKIGQKLKADFAEIIKDKSIPLNDRWELFSAAPDYLKEHERWAQDFECLDDSAVMYGGWLLHVERHELVDTSDIVSAILDNEDFLYHLPGEDTQKVNEKGVALFNTLREEILERNLGSFTYDW